MTGTIDKIEAMKGKIVLVQIMQCYDDIPLVLPDESNQ